MKYTQEQVKVHKQFITVADMKDIAPKHGVSWETLRRVLIGEGHYDTGRPERKAMIAEAKKLIKQRAINALEVIEPKTVR